MRGTFLALTLTLVLPLTAQVESERPARAFLEMSSDRARPFRHQLTRVQLRIGVDQAFARDHLIQLFRTPLDLPVQLDAPWLDRLVGLQFVTPTPARAALRIAVNQAAEKVRRLPDEQRDGRTFTVLMIEGWYLPERVGPRMLPAASLQFAHATSFREDLLRGRIPLDQRKTLVDGPTVRLDVRALPTAGRPTAFSGAVGRFRLQAEAQLRTMAADQPFKLTLTLEGEGNFGHFEVPTLADHPGLHVLGRVERETTTSRVIIYDLKPLAGLQAIPSIAFCYFEIGSGESGRYRTIQTAKIPLEIRSSSTSAVVRPSGKPGIDDIFALKSSRESTHLLASHGPPGLLLLLLLSGLPWLLSLGLRSVLRMRTQAANPARQRARGAQTAFLRHIETNPDQLADALVEYIAARLGCAPAAVITHDLAKRLESGGIEAQLAQATEARLEQLFALRYQGSTTPLEAGRDPALAEVRELVEALETIFTYGTRTIS